MRRLSLFHFIAALLLLCLCVSGVFATWVYIGSPEPAETTLLASLGNFTYGPFYITKAEIVGGSYANASVTKKSDVNITADIELNKNTSSTVVVEVTFYNNTEVSYYYNKTETISSNNDSISYSVTGIEQKEEVPSKTFKTLKVTFEFDSNNTSNTSLLSELHFNFVVDKSSIGTIVAQTAVGRFADILNNVVADDSYQTLEDAMNNRGGSFNKGSAVTYIGNVSGAANADSQMIMLLFTEEFLAMDLDGDGESEPITLMIKRENLDGDASTGASYTYTSWGREYTVNGVEMTIYITSEGFDSNTLVVYAATFTKMYNETKWVQIVPLTKGTATANNYNGYGAANSFNTDTWKSDNGKTIETLVSENMAN